MFLLWARPSSATADTGPGPGTSPRWTSSSSARGWTRSRWDTRRPSCPSASGLRCRCHRPEHLEDGERERERVQVSSVSVAEGVMMFTEQTSTSNVMCIVILCPQCLNFLAPVREEQKRNPVFFINMSPCLFSVLVLFCDSTPADCPTWELTFSWFRLHRNKIQRYKQLCLRSHVY